MSRIQERASFRSGGQSEGRKTRSPRRAQAETSTRRPAVSSTPDSTHHRPTKRYTPAPS